MCNDGNVARRTSIGQIIKGDNPTNKGCHEKHELSVILQTNFSSDSQLTSAYLIRIGNAPQFQTQGQWLKDLKLVKRPAREDILTDPVGRCSDHSCDSVSHEEAFGPAYQESYGIEILYISPYDVPCIGYKMFGR
jgi:hypothetical protein